MLRFCVHFFATNESACTWATVAENSDCELVVVNLSDMIVQYLKKLTFVDGGTNRSLEEGDTDEPTSFLVSSLPDLEPGRLWVGVFL